MESRPLQAPNRRSPLQLGKAPGKQRIEDERLNQAPLQRCQQCNLSQEPWGPNELLHKRFLATVESKHILQYFQGKTWQPLAPVAPAPSLQDDQPWKYRLRCLRWALDNIDTHFFCQRHKPIITPWVEDHLPITVEGQIQLPPSNPKNLWRKLYCDLVFTSTCGEELLFQMVSKKR